MPREIKIEKVRNIGIMAHIDAGKTTTTERMLYYSGTSHKIGEVHDGNTVMDWMDQEKERGITITSAATSFYWKNYQFNLIDTPGHVDFTIEVERALRILDGAVAVFCSVGGVEPQSETVWRQSIKYNVPKIAFVNKMDRVGANFKKVIDSMIKKLNANPVIVNFPYFVKDDFVGVIDVIKGKLILYDEETLGSNFEYKEIPSNYLDEYLEVREKLIEVASSVDDEILELYLEDMEIDEKRLYSALRTLTISNLIVPVFCGSAFKNKGVQNLLDGIVELFPSPIDLPPIKGYDENNKLTLFRKTSDNEPFSAIVFKTQIDPFVGQLSYFRVYSGSLKTGSTVFNSNLKVRERINKILRMHANQRSEIKDIFAGDIACAVGLSKTTTGCTICDESYKIVYEPMTFPEPVMFIAIEPKVMADYDRLLNTLEKINFEDPTFEYRIDKDTGQLLISGMGELHLEIIVVRLLRDFKLAANVGKPQVAYKETISEIGIGEGLVEKSIGGKSQFAYVKFELSPNDRGAGNAFQNNLVDITLPKDFITFIEDSVKCSLFCGTLIGYPLVDVKVKLIEVIYKEEESTDIAFKVASSIGVQNGIKNSTPVLLEPLMYVEVTIPNEYIGDVISDINQRRGKVLSISNLFDLQVVAANVPLAEMFQYSNKVRSITSGRASFYMKFIRYEVIPSNVQNKILEKARGYC